jgi:hypothetical protein
MYNTTGPRTPEEKPRQPAGRRSRDKVVVFVKERDWELVSASLECLDESCEKVLLLSLR